MEVLVLPPFAVKDILVLLDLPEPVSVPQIVHPDMAGFCSLHDWRSDSSRKNGSVQVFRLL